MKVELLPFQKTALFQLRQSAATALGNYRSTHIPQVVSYTAPTGAGKTIVMSALIEAIFYGDESYPDQNEAIFIWLSDSPQLNEQSRLKIDLKADKIRLNQCVTISDDSFDMEALEDGHIYFLNTQKLSTSSNLTKHSDGRQYTIWETLANTVRDKADRLYFIIDEAHRGAQNARDLTKNTTIMQKFLKGSTEDKLPPMPVVIGMTATPQRFNRLAEGIQSTTHYVKTTADEVRASGLLKDRIIITYPEHAGNDMAVLQAATDEWKHKCDHWYQYCYEQHYAQVNPILIVQVQNGSGQQISATDLDECLRIIEERLGDHFSEGQVIHAFGEGTPTLRIGGLDVPYCEPSRIADDKRIKVVFFKETLTTGWDCPRAETMMSFRRAVDYTYIAQLLGRMVRTPTQQHINVDETLNDVHLYLPQFSEETVNDVVNALQDEEGAKIPTDIEAQKLGYDKYDTLSLRPTYTTPPRQSGRPRSCDPNQFTLPGFDDNPPEQPSEATASVAPTTPAESTPAEQTTPATGSDSNASATSAQPPASTHSTATHSVGSAPSIPPQGFQDIDREAVVKAINDAGLLTYDVRRVRITDYLKSMYALARFLTQTRLDTDAKEIVLSEITEKIHEHIRSLKQSGMYDDLVRQVLQFKLSAQIFDVFGRSIDDYAIHDLFSTTDADIERQFRLAETRLGSEGVGNAYVNRYYDEDDVLNLQIQVIIFAANAECMNALSDYAERKFHELNDTNRRRTVSLPEKFRKKYDDIVSDGDIISKHNFRLPEAIRVPHEMEGRLYGNHLFVDDSGTALINLNGWERKVIAEEEQREDFVCWLRNPSRGSWALCIPYEIDGQTKPTYPDFLIIRRDGSEYVVDILEPHDPTRQDNLGKAKGFAEYARQNPGVGRIQLIRMQLDSIGKERAFRLDMSRSSIRDKVSRCASNDELNHIFESDGFFQ
ncbi:MAG: DEAD/DEAH box helicase family protein [Synergistaceae bacterium]|nr:DEAD/DEAH box helicase family protein [Synergistaceae bacterium]